MQREHGAASRADTSIGRIAVEPEGEGCGVEPALLAASHEAPVDLRLLRRRRGDHHVVGSIDNHRPMLVCRHTF